MSLVREIYRITEHLPASEQYGLAIQMRRSALSIPANIAEGYLRHSRREYVRFVSIAEASAAELETYLCVLKELYPAIPVIPVVVLCSEVQKMFTALQRRLRHPNPNP